MIIRLPVPILSITLAIVRHDLCLSSTSTAVERLYGPEGDEVRLSALRPLTVPDTRPDAPHIATEGLCRGLVAIAAPSRRRVWGKPLSTAYKDKRFRYATYF